MITVVIGAPYSGKTTYIENRYLKGKKYEVINDILPYTLVEDGTILLGRYDEPDRYKGCDVYQRDAAPKIKKLTKKLAGRGYNVVADGERVENRSCIDYFMGLGTEVELIYVYATKEVIPARRKADKHKISIQYIKGRGTSSKNLLLEYCPFVKTQVVNGGVPVEH